MLIERMRGSFSTFLLLLPRDPAMKSMTVRTLFTPSQKENHQLTVLLLTPFVVTGVGCCLLYSDYFYGCNRATHLFQFLQLK